MEGELEKVDHIKRAVQTLDNILDTGRKRHTIGGILLSASLFLGGLAITALTIITEEDSEDDQSN